MQICRIYAKIKESESISDSLKYYFSIFPYISIVALPCLSFNIFKDEGIFNSIAVNDFTKIFVKWLSCFIIFCFSIFAGITTPILVNQFGNIEVAQILTGYLSILFYGASIISLSIFIQVIIKNKVASLITTVLILFISFIISSAAALSLAL